MGSEVTYLVGTEANNVFQVLFIPVILSKSTASAVPPPVADNTPEEFIVKPAPILTTPTVSVVAIGKSATGTVPEISL